MKIQLLSDLHLEAHPHWTAQPAQGADVLVLAGDIGSYQSGSQLAGTDFGLAGFSPHHGWPTPVIFVPGNHEYDGLDIDATRQRLRQTCERLGIVWLEQESLVIGGVRFLGTTLWTDFDALSPTQAQTGIGHGVNPAVNLLAQQLRARDKAYRAANYYLRKNHTLRDGQPVLAEGIRALGLECQRWLEQALSNPFAGPTVVVTHFAPSLLSADPRYGCTPGTAGFCNALDHLLPLAQCWLHGHLHAPSDYMHQGCRVVANPLGYARKNEQAAFKPELLIRIGPKTP
jgi:predicted phosphodiesterase